MKATLAETGLDEKVPVHVCVFSFLLSICRANQMANEQTSVVKGHQDVTRSVENPLTGPLSVCVYARACVFGWCRPALSGWPMERHQW